MKEGEGKRGCKESKRSLKSFIIEDILNTCLFGKIGYSENIFSFQTNNKGKFSKIQTPAEKKKKKSYVFC